MTTSNNELVALKTVKGFNDLAKRAADKAVDSLTLAWKAGELAQEAKDSLPHGEFMSFVETHYAVGHKTVTRWMQFRKDVPESKLDTVSNLAAGTKMLEAPKPPKKRKPKPPASPVEPSDDDSTDSTTDDSEAPEADVTVAEEPGTGICPCCGKGKWTEDEDGEFDCEKCHHPWGEPAGDRDEKVFRTQRAKTVKTAEALIRAFADLNRISAIPGYKTLVLECRKLLRIAKDCK